MKKFRFIGDPSDYTHKVEFNRVYDGDFYIKEWSRYIEEEAYLYPEDWEEVTGQDTRIPNQDHPASSMTKFEMAVFMAMQGLLSNPNITDEFGDGIGNLAIDHAEEQFIKLENLKK